MNIRLKKVFFYRPFLLMWGAMFGSMVGTYLLILVLSAHVYLATQSNFYAGAVMVVQWLPAVVLFPAIGYLCDRHQPQTTLILADLFSAATSLAIGFLFDPQTFFPVFLVLLGRGFLEGLTKSARVVALKHYIPSHYLEKASSIFNTSFYLGAGVGGLLGTFLANHLSLRAIACLDAATFIFSALCYSLLKNKDTGPFKKEEEAARWKEGFLILKKNPPLREPIISLGMTVALYQGYHTIARTVLPMDHLELGASGVTLFQFITCLALVAGALFVSKFLIKNGKFYGSPPFLMGTTSLAMIVTLYTRSLAGTLLVYFSFMFLFEVTYTKLTNAIVTCSPKESMGKIAAFYQSLCMALMMVVVFAGGKAMDFFGFSRVTWVMACIGLLFSFLTHFQKEEARESP